VFRESVEELYQLAAILGWEWRKAENANVCSGAG
jgi:hypothetical protein